RETNAGSMDHPLFTISFAAKNGKEQLDTLLKHDMADARGLGGCHAALLRECGVRSAECGMDEMAIQRGWLVMTLTATVSTAHADDAKATSLGIEQARRFGRNRKLIHALVDNCVRLAVQPDFVQRADLCTNVADQLADELHGAAGDRDLARATELGRFLKDLLVQGVAFNLTTAN